MSGVNNDITFNFYQKYRTLLFFKKFTDRSIHFTDENIIGVVT